MHKAIGHLKKYTESVVFAHLLSVSLGVWSLQLEIPYHEYERAKNVMMSCKDLFGVFKISI